MKELATQFQQMGMSELANQFARFIARQESENKQDVAIAAALLSEAVQQGHVCLDLNKAWVLFPDWKEWIPQNISDWEASLRRSISVGEEGDDKPLILSADSKLYLYRHWQDEYVVANLIQARCNAVDVDLVALKLGFDAWPSTVKDGVDWQKVAALMAVSRQFSVISGGPGTGKTTVVTQVLRLLQQQSGELRIMLAAPTGKAAARIEQAVFGVELKASKPIGAQTIHRLLGITEQRTRGKYNADNLLPLDVLIIDEASMIDMSLMAQILVALPLTARLILLGDSRQLASIESGAVLDSLCRHGVSLSTEFLSQLKETTGITLAMKTSTDAPLIDSVVILQHNYRFSADSIVEELAAATLVGDSDTMLSLLQRDKNSWQGANNSKDIEKALATGYEPYIHAIMARSEPEKCMAEFARYRMLCALRKGPESVAAANALLEKHVRQLGWETEAKFYHGQAIIITQNNYPLQLFNGDTGLILPHPESGELYACFRSQAGLKWILPLRLPAYETAFAMTVHKAQGTEFDAVDILLPVQNNPLLNRELLYTALTRARNKVGLLASDATIRHTIASKYQRDSGLEKRLSNERTEDGA